MRTSNKIAIIKTLQKKEISLFTLADFSRLFAIDNRNTLYKKIQRLEKSEIIKRLTKGKYLFLLKKPNQFEIANFLYQPSYISLESALSFYGILEQFPYQITSVTTKKTKLYTFNQEPSFKYAQISQDFFWGYEKKESFLIADKEKSLLDYLYLGSKGWRILNLDKLRNQFDLSEINRKKLKNYYKMIKNPSFLKFLKKAKI
ncbi:hypothetical protein ISS85_02045 [Candidatus Microgenomates bacterium]|nr:hypothetical protein [Candidatus Microgenomates bacterium]